MTAPPVPDLAELAYRLAARMVDQGAGVAALLGGAILGAVAGRLLPDLDYFAGILGQLTGLGVVLVLTVFQWFLIASEGTTLGKRLVGIRIVREDGGAVGFVDGVILRTWVVGLLVPVTLGLFALLDVLPIFAADRRCVHDRIARTRVVLDPRKADADGADPHSAEVRRGLAFSRRLSISLMMVAFMGGALVVQNVLVGMATTVIGGLGTVVLIGLVIGLVVAAALVYDCRPAGVVGAAVVTGAVAVFAASWFAYLLALGAASVLAWLLASAAGYLVVISALFVAPAGRVSAARSQADELAMLAELGVG